MCQHTHHAQIGPDRCYHGSVADTSDAENPIARGNISITVECRDCGAQRRENSNAGRVELGPWGPSRAERDAAERAEMAAAKQRQREVDAAVADGCFSSILVHADDTDLITVVLRRDGSRHVMTRSQITAAAEQDDTGDGLVQAYRGLQTAVSMAQRGRHTPIASS